MKIGYARVSTAEQHEGRQMEWLKGEGVEKIFLDKLSGKNTHRPQLQTMLDYIREGDTVYVESFSRLARNVTDLLMLVRKIESKEAHVVSSKENFDTSTPTGKLLLTLVGGIAEFERDIMLQRQREGIALAKKQGKYRGRKPTDKPSDWPELYEQYRTRQMTAKELIQRTGASRSVVYRWIDAEKAGLRNK